MAAGSVQVGDKVLATDPITGATTAETVAHVWVDRDDDLMDVTVVSHGTPSVVHTTAHHPFWDATRHAWVEADRLTPGDQLRSVDGATVTYTSETVVPGTADMWDLTITSDHDFYIHTVDAGTVLVHNCPSDADLEAAGRARGSGPRALKQLAKEANENGGVTREDADTLDGWREEYGVKGHGTDIIHSNHAGEFDGVPHIRIGSIHIRIF
jgi:hypothetical protein